MSEKELPKVKGLFDSLLDSLLSFAIVVIVVMSVLDMIRPLVGYTLAVVFVMFAGAYIYKRSRRW